MTSQKLLKYIAYLFVLSSGFWGITQAGAFTPDKTTDKQLTVDFLKIAYGDEYSQTKGVLRKWMHDIQYFVEGTAPFEAQQLFKGHLTTLKTLTGRRFIPTNTQSSAQMVVIWSPKSDYHKVADKWFPNQENTKKRLRRVNCFVSISTQNGKIIRSIVVMPPNFPRPRLKHCIVEELTQAMGLINDNNTVMPSMFNDRYKRNDLTWKDEVFLKVLYDSALTPGLDYREAQLIIPGLISKHRQ